MCERIFLADVDVKTGKAGLLPSSAFVTLGVSVRSNKDQILEAYDDRLFEGAAHPVQRFFTRIRQHDDKLLAAVSAGNIRTVPHTLG